uniref:Hypersensitive-induced response protein n=1 Tax=Tetraselmis sp. GSL018 TaxID=582737 RepID=A0A061SAR5_9CHLO|mmetsp:Transcript_7695/g.18429  ORF Transcript_7695/g.18429 Transcript_7695/m.18429 type:complete len:292 (-) Transcript_7695:101-976(-)
MGACFSCPDQSKVDIIAQFGKFKRVAYPGFNCVQCYLGESVSGSLSLRIQQLDVRCETKSKDNVFVNIVVSVQYQVIKESIIDAFYKLTDSRSQITSYVFDVVRSTVPKMNLDDVFTMKEEIAQAIKQELSQSMEAFGYTIIQTLVTDIDPDQKVKNAMNDINSAQRLRVAALERAEAEKVQVVKAAEADAEAKYLAGQGIARQRQAIVNGLRESILLFSDQVKDVDSQSVMDLMLVTQYFDTIKDIGGQARSTTVFLPHQPGAVGDIASQVRNGFMQAARSQEMTREHQE